MRKPASQNEAERVVHALEEDIIFGRLLPRMRLVEDEMIERFGVKRHVVRQAITELERMGIARKEAYKGAMVRDFTIDEVEQIYEMRELLQERAARRMPLPGSPALVAALKEIQARHSAAVEAGDLGAVFRENNAFHDALFGGCGNPYMAESIAQYAWLSHAIRSYRIADPVLLRQAEAEHHAIIRAVEDGDRDALVRLSVDHIKPSKDAYLKLQAVPSLRPRSAA